MSNAKQSLAQVSEFMFKSDPVAVSVDPFTEQKRLCSHLLTWKRGSVSSQGSLLNWQTIENINLGIFSLSKSR